MRLKGMGELCLSYIKSKNHLLNYRWNLGILSRMVSVIRNGFSDASSNPEQVCLHFALH